MFSCRDATRLLSETRERGLAWRERLALRLHLAMCSGCRRFGQQVHFLSAAAKRYKRDEQDSPERS